LFELYFGVAALVGQHGFILRDEFVGDGYFLLLGFADESFLICLCLCL
jgi:hypothetical protein